MLTKFANSSILFGQTLAERGNNFETEDMKPNHQETKILISHQQCNLLIMKYSPMGHNWQYLYAATSLKDKGLFQAYYWQFSFLVQSTSLEPIGHECTLKWPLLQNLLSVLCYSSSSDIYKSLLSAWSSHIRSNMRSNEWAIKLCNTSSSRSCR